LIDPKTVIDVESAKRSEAVMLFADRAQLNNPEFELASQNVSEVVTICNKLDGIPLAVELVASRTRHMDAQMILERFEGRFDRLSSSDPGTSKRQQTLQATIEWSYNLLSDGEKILFARLAVFSGGFDIEASEEICSDNQLPEDEILDLLSRLVDRSLVYTTKEADQLMRYKRLETLQQFAQQKLKSQKEEEILKNRHLQYYLTMAEQAYKEQYESQLKWMNTLEQEHDNMIAALNWAEIHSPEDFLKLSGTLAWFWRQHSHTRLGMDFLEKALLKADSGSEPYARIIFGFGNILFFTGEGQRALNLMNESLSIWRQFNNLWEQAIVLREISILYHSIEDHKRGAKCSEQSLEIAREIDKAGLINFCLGYVCLSLIFIKEYERAKPLVEELLVSSEKLNQPTGIINAHHFSGDVALGSKNFKEAEREYGPAVTSALKFVNPMQACIDLQGVAFSVSGQARWAKSIRLDASTRKHATQFGLKFDGLAGFWDEWIETYLKGARKDVGEELTKKYEEEGGAMSFDKAVEYALDFEKD